MSRGNTSSSRALSYLNQSQIHAAPQPRLTTHIFETAQSLLAIFARLFVKRFSLCYRTIVLSVCLLLSVCDICVFWPNDWIYQDKTWQGDGSWPQRHCVRWGPSSPKRRGAQQPPPHFLPTYCRQRLDMDQDAIWYGGRPRPRRHCVRWGPNSPQKGALPPLFDHVYCGQTAGWIKMPLGKEVGCSAGHILLDGDPAPPNKEHSQRQSPIFGPCVLWPNGRPSQLLLSTCCHISMAFRPEHI